MGSDRPHTDTQMRPLEKGVVSLSLALLLGVSLFQTLAQAHAFPLRSDPRVGWTVPVSPPKVTIWFDGELEPAFSSITVYNSMKQQVDKGNSRVSGPDATVLEVDLPPLASGTYHVYWKALAKDTHVTEGDFTFAIEKK
jgi:copper resistance protein C